MDDDQARDIRESIEELARLYPIGISEKKVAWTNLVFSVGGWAAPGLIAIYKRPRQRPGRPQAVPQPIRDTQAASPSPAAVVDLPGGLANPVTGDGAAPSQAKTPSQMWNQPGDIDPGDAE